jgi:hypothetical protein
VTSWVNRSESCPQIPRCEDFQQLPLTGTQLGKLQFILQVTASADVACCNKLINRFLVMYTAPSSKLISTPSPFSTTWRVRKDMLVEARAVPLVLYLPCLVYLDVRLVRDHPSCRPLHERPDEGTGNQLYSAMSSGVCFLAGTPRTKWGGGRE